ncbi:MAG: hypothetical protein B6I26_03075 [Desulfobacteraceae bacterium 4572_130]|nr:MAG: hypothetical protein B6I26_03075 [Desulfobacteraceae bacterium 4572_130]
MEKSKKWPIKKLFICLCFMIFAGFIINNCGDSSENNLVTVGNVSITKFDNYYKVIIDKTDGTSDEKTGENYAEAIKLQIPDTEFLFDSYLNEQLKGSQAALTDSVNIAKIIKNNTPQEYQDEINGIINKLASIDSGTLGDGKLDEYETLVASFIPDLRAKECSAISVFGDLSETSTTITGRNLDWPIGSQGQLGKFHAVTIIKNQDKSIVLMGFLGYLGCLTGFNNDKVFAGILDSPTMETITSSNWYSYPYDLRYALENETSLNDVADFMKTNTYTFNHLIFLSDEYESKVLENNISTGGNRALRTDDSTLRSSIAWGFENAIGTVNSFLLNGNFNNHTVATENTARWASMKTQLDIRDDDDTITYNELKEIITYDGGVNGIPENYSDGDLYSEGNMQTIIFQPAIFKLDMAFTTSAIRPDNPNFQTIFENSPFEETN